MTSGICREDVGSNPIHDQYFPLANFKILFKVVRKTLRKLDPSKSSNGAGPRFLRKCADVLATMVDRLFKYVVSEAECPVGWKVGRVTPVHKRGKVSEKTNYRPITVLDNVEAAFEDCTKPQFEGWNLSFIPDWQYGFVSGHGTADYGAAMSFTLQDCLERR